ncbi:2-phosphosulfolactate phosphatase [Phnomibacter ginsenosidimutans]|uniref:2-phosphosulfolactate phosphatase n=1 Tax=Phnomibacter ginsenosidimutans TaxID=2676868 RepID=UPI0024845AC3|nr:2-phosphosulfolactate phosphatase [Phnomibacter ginsenosidimutans]
MEDSLFAGAVVSRVRQHFQVFCDASLAAETLYTTVKDDLWNYTKQTTHYHRLASYGLEKDMEWCITHDIANVLPVYQDGALIAKA